MPSATSPTAPVPTANDRLKARFGTCFWASLTGAAVLHFLLLAFAPELTAEDISLHSSEMEHIELPPEVDIPPPPEPVARPAVPLLSTSVNVDPDVTIAPNVFSDNPPAELPPPPTGSTDLSDAPSFTPYEVRPQLRNRDELARAVLRAYPPTLRDAGIGGSVVVWVYLDETGAVQNTRVAQGSGYEAFDQVAEVVVRETARFTPALNRDQRVPVWVQLPVRFEAP